MTPSPEHSRPGLARLLPLLAFVLLGALLFVGVLLSGREDREALPSPLIGKPAPAFQLPSLHEPDRLVSPEDLAGQPYVMNVWGSWCPECRIEHPVFTRFAETARVPLVGYNLKDEPADALRWLEQFGDPYSLVLVDYSGDSAIDWGIYGAPETFLVDAEGIVRWKHVGVVSEQVMAEQLLPALAELEAGR